MAQCEKCNQGITDNHCGCSHFDGLFGYKIDINKKDDSSEPSSKKNNASQKGGGSKIGDALSKVDLSKASGAIEGLLSGLGKKTSSSPQPGPSGYPDMMGPQPKKSNMGWIIGLVAALVVVIVVIAIAKRKK